VQVEAQAIAQGFQSGTVGAKTGILVAAEGRAHHAGQSDPGLA
jgi:hypothetical protein